MKKLLLALVILSTLVSCGKKNTVGTVTNSGIINAISASTQVESDFLTRVNGNQFAVNATYYGEPLAQAIARGANPQYRYANVAAPQAGTQNCHTVLVIFTACGGYSSTSMQTLTITRTVSHTSLSVVDQQNKLISIFNKKQSVSFDGRYFRIFTNDNKTYYFDTALAIQAQPTSTYNADGSGEVFFNVI